MDWTAPEDEGSSPVTSYQLAAYYRLGPGVIVELWTGTTTGPTAILFFDQTALQINIQASNTFGDSEALSWQFDGTGRPACTEDSRESMGQPTELNAVAEGIDVELAWTAPNTDGGSTVSNYHVEYSTNDGTTWASAGSVNSTSAAMSGLLSSTEYLFRVKVGVSGTGYTIPSDVVSVTTG